MADNFNKTFQRPIPSDAKSSMHGKAERTKAKETPPLPSTTQEKEATKIEIRLAPLTLPPDSVVEPMYQQEDEEDETVRPATATTTDEEQAGVPPSTDNSSEGGLSHEDDEVFSAYLVPDPERTRNELFEQAVSATNVHVVAPREQRRRNKKIPLLLAIFILAGIGIALALAFGLSNKTTKTVTSSTIPPTPAPTSARFAQVATLVDSLFGTDLDDTLSSSQHQAALWMADVDNAFMDLTSVDPDRFRQRYALVVFYFATGGPTSWIDSSFFLQPNHHECEWVDTSIENPNSFSGAIGVINCTQDLFVNRIEISQNNLTGSLPKEIGVLSTLTELTLNWNTIGGTIPPSLFHLSELQSFMIWDSDLTGTIPTDVGRATSLVVIIFSKNSLTGTLATEMGNLRNLRILSLYSNFLTGSLPEPLFRLSSLDTIVINDNALTGTLPPSISLSWPNLVSMTVNYNQLSGRIPNGWSSLPLEHLGFSFNSFEGPFPSSVTKLSTLKSLTVMSNALTGPLPSDWTNLSESLYLLLAGFNMFTGTIPFSLGNLTGLEQLALSDNALTGTIPSSLGKATDLEQLFLYSNNLTGTVPTSLLQLTRLRLFWLQLNRISGDMSFLCNGTEELLPQLFQLAADCLGEVDCPCCFACCDPDDYCVEMAFYDGN